MLVTRLAEAAPPTLEWIRFGVNAENYKSQADVLQPIWPGPQKPKPYGLGSLEAIGHTAVAPRDKFSGRQILLLFETLPASHCSRRLLCWKLNDGYKVKTAGHVSDASALPLLREPLEQNRAETSGNHSSSIGIAHLVHL